MAGDTLAYTIEHPSQPSEVHLCPTDGSGERQLSDFNPWWRERTPILAEVWEFQVPDGQGGTEKIEGWLLRAEGSSGPLPLLNDVHGGPSAYALLDFDTNVFWQVLCSRGWAVLALNAVGSASYGREFCDRLMGHWGEYDLPQHLAAVKQLQDEGVCDERTAIAGKSYGGYLSGWAIGQTAMFRAAVVMAPVGNIETHYGTSDGGYYADPYYMGTQDRFDRALAKKLSPMAHVEKATTPTLFMQGADDERCPKCQSEELFVSLMRAGTTPTELVLYPGEDHHFLGEGTPSVREDAAQRIVAWLEQHIDQAPAQHRTQQDAEGAQPASRGAAG
jgi:dipeptidyl aminopeptidase/acylaminoacyl peptidase